MLSRCSLFFLIGFAVSAAHGGPPRVDRHGDPLPSGTRARLGTLRLRGASPPKNVALTRDGKLAAVSFFSRTIRLLELPSGTCRANVTVERADFLVLAFSPAGDLLATTCLDSRAVRVWDTTSGKLLRSLPAKRVHSLAFSPDGKTLAGGGGSRRGVRLWSTATGRELRAVGKPDSGGHALAFSPDGKLLATENNDHSLGICDLASGKELLRLPEQKGEVRSLCFSPDSKILASVCVGLALRLWDTRSGKEVRRFTTGRHQVDQVIFSPDGQSILADAGANALIRWDVRTGKELGRWQDGRNYIYCAAFSADGCLAVVGSGNGPHVLRMIDTVHDREIIRGEGHRSAVTSLAFSPDGKTLASCSSEGDDQGVLLWDVRSGRARRLSDNRPHGACAVAFAPDGKTLASCSTYEGTVRLWDVPSGKEVRRLKGEVAPGGLAFSPDGRLLAAVGPFYEDEELEPAGSRLRLWELDGGRQKFIHEGSRFGDEALAFTRDGRFLVTTDGDMRVWSVRSGKRCRTLGRPIEDIRQAALSPDGWLIAWRPSRSGFSVRELATGLELFRERGVRAFSWALAFSTDGRLLASAGSDGVARLWCAASGELVQELKGHAFGAVRSVAFAPDGKTLATGGSDSAILLWDIRPALRKVPCLSRKELDKDALKRAWCELAATDSTTVNRSFRALAAAPTSAPLFLKEVLRPAPATDARRLARLIADLNSRRFTRREQATAELEELGEVAEPALRAALEDSPSLELRRRVERLLENLESATLPPEMVRMRRAVRALEVNGSPAARRLLQALAGGGVGARLTRAAAAALKRLGSRPPVP